MKKSRRVRVFERDGGRCWYCGAEVTIEDAQIDHKTPRCDGGDDSDENLVIACRDCNAVKGPLTVEGFRMKLVLGPKGMETRMRVYRNIAQLFMPFKYVKFYGERIADES